MWKFITITIVLTFVIFLLSCSETKTKLDFCTGYKEGLRTTKLEFENCPETHRINSYEYGLLKGLEKSKIINPFAANIENSIFTGQDDPIYQTIREYGKSILGLDLDSLSVHDVAEIRSIYSGYLAKLEVDLIAEGLDHFERETILKAVKSQVPHAGLLINRRRMYIISMMKAHTGDGLDELCKRNHPLCVNQIPKLIYNNRTCSKDCSGHIAGYNWAKQRVLSGALIDEEDCLNGKSNSFVEGCYSYFDV